MLKFKNHIFLAIFLLILSAAINASPDDATGIIRVDKERLSGMNLGEFTKFKFFDSCLNWPHFFYINENNLLSLFSLFLG